MSTEYLVYVCFLLTLNAYWVPASVNIMRHPCCHIPESQMRKLRHKELCGLKKIDPYSNLRP